MGLLILVIIAFVIVVVVATTVICKSENEEKSALYRITFGGWYWVDPMSMIISELPKLKPELARWELYVEQKQGRDHLTLNHLDQVTNTVTHVLTKDLTRRKYGGRWSELNGCTNGFQKEQVHSTIVQPFLSVVDSMLEHGTIKGHIQRPPQSYTII